VNVTGYSLIDGMSGAMDTLGSQHNGAGGLSDCIVMMSRIADNIPYCIRLIITLEYA